MQKIPLEKMDEDVKRALAVIDMRGTEFCMNGDRPLDERIICEDGGDEWVEIGVGTSVPAMVLIIAAVVIALVSMVLKKFFCFFGQGRRYFTFEQ